MAGEHSSCVLVPVGCWYPGPQWETEQQVELKDKGNELLGREGMELEVRGICPIKNKPRALRKGPQRQDPTHSRLQLGKMKMHLKGKNLNWNWNWKLSPLKAAMLRLRGHLHLGPRMPSCILSWQQNLVALSTWSRFWKHERYTTEVMKSRAMVPESHWEQCVAELDSPVVGATVKVKPKVQWEPQDHGVPPEKSCRPRVKPTQERRFTSCRQERWVLLVA